MWEWESHAIYIVSFSLLHFRVCCRHAPSCSASITLHSLLANLLTDDISFLLCSNAACCFEPSALVCQSATIAIFGPAQTNTRSWGIFVPNWWNSIVCEKATAAETNRDEESTSIPIFYKWFSLLIDIGRNWVPVSETFISVVSSLLRSIRYRNAGRMEHVLLVAVELRFNDKRFFFAEKKF